MRSFLLSCLLFLGVINPLFSEEPERMLVISPSIFMETLQPLIEWRILNGIEIDILNMDSVEHTPTALKAAIAERYAIQPFTYLLLVGDDMYIPAHVVRKSDKYYIMDNWYAEFLGEEGRPDVAMGRFSAETAEQVAMQVRKTIDYEANPPEMQHFSSFAGIASESGPGYQNEYDFEHIRNLGKQLLDYTYSTGYEFFEGTHGELDAPNDPHAGMISSAINDGVGILLYCGHGESDRFVTGNFQSSHINSLTNYNKLPFVISTACFNGNYAERTCMAEHWLRASHEGKATGAVAAFMCSGNVEWNEPMAGQDEIVNMLTNPAIGQQEKTLGKMAFQGLRKILDTYGNPETTRSWLLFGDPALTVRTAEPQSLSVTVDTIFPIGTTNLTVSSSTESAKVVLSTKHQVLAIGYIHNGTATLPLLYASQEDTIQLLVTAFNHVPVQHTITFSGENATTEHPSAKNIQIYPNPTEGVIYIGSSSLVTEQFEAVICSIAGKKISSFLLSGTTSQINLSHLPQGIYIIQLIHQNKIISTDKIIKH